MDALLRLVWALPLVLLTGAVLVLLLKRVMKPLHSSAAFAQRLSLRESLSVSDETRVHLIDLDGTACLLVESTRQATLHLPAVGAKASVSPAGPRWMQRLYEVKR
ncbi:MAG TPA: hypothetical protein VIU34_30075 [Steroidobacter sp.]